MPLAYGPDAIIRFYEGSTEIQSAYYGSTLVYSALDPGSLVIEDSTLDVTDGGTVNLRVKLGAVPGSNVVVAASETSPAISISTASRTFTPTNWDTYQSFTVTSTVPRRLLIVDVGTSRLYEIDPDGADSQGGILRGLSPADISMPRAITNFKGRLLIADDDDPSELFEIDPDGANAQGTSLGLLPSALVSPYGMTNFNGRLLIVNSSGDLYEIDPDGDQREQLRDLPSGLASPYSMANFKGRLLIANLDEELLEIDPDGADTQGVVLRDLPSGLGTAAGMTNFNGRLLIADDGGDDLYEIDPDGADSQGVVLRGLPLSTPQGMTSLYEPASAVVSISASGPDEYAGVTGSATVTVT